MIDGRSFSFVFINAYYIKMPKIILKDEIESVFIERLIYYALKDKRIHM